MIASRVARACALTAILIAVVPVSGQAVSVASFDGRYVFVGGDAERRQLHRAIDGAVSRLPFLLREVARGEIRRNIQPEPSIAIDVAGEAHVRLTLGAWGPIDLRLDGLEQRVRGPDGSATRLSAGYRGGRIETRQASSRGRRENWLSLSPDGRHLFLQSRVGAPQLPEEIRYTLTYRRES